MVGLGLSIKNQDWIAKYDSPLISGMYKMKLSDPMTNSTFLACSMTYNT